MINGVKWLGNLLENDMHNIWRLCKQFSGKIFISLSIFMTITFFVVSSLFFNATFSVTNVMNDENICYI